MNMLNIDKNNNLEENGSSIVPMELKDKMELKLKNSSEVIQLVKSIDVKNAKSIMQFGGGASEKISGFSDNILKSYDMSKIEKSNEIIIQLNKIMEQFNIDDFSKENLEKKPGLIEKIFNNTKNKIEKILSKYHTMGDEIEKVYVCLKQIEDDMEQSNKNLDVLLEQSVQYYEQLKMYIVAGEMAIEELNTEILPQLEKQFMASGDNMDKLNYNQLLQVKDMMEQRVQDLRLSENLALQTIPSIRLIQYGNYNYLRKLNSAFIVTLPSFKQAMIQSIELKKQSITAKSLETLDQKTNEIILRNSQNLALQTKQSAKLSTGSFVQIETLEKSWSTIMDGIEGAKQIQQDAKKKRAEDKIKLQNLKQEIQSKGNI